MSKDNRAMSIEEKFGEYCRLNKGKAQVSKKSAFIQGYCLAEKEMQEKLDAAIRAKGIACLKHNLIHHIGCGHCIDEAIEVIKFYADKDSWNYSSNSLSEINTEDWYTCPIDKAVGKLVWVGGKRARDFLKARGE